MPSDRERSDRDRGEGRRGGSNNGGSAGRGGALPRNAETAIRALTLLDEILQSTDPIDPNYQYLLLLRHQLEVDERQSVEAQEMIEKYDEAYTKLTQPANRVAVFLSKNDDGTANVAMGDNDLYTNVDPNVELDALTAGTRVKRQRGHAVVGDLGPAQNGQVVKVTEALDDGRLRIGGDMQGMNTRVVVRGEGLKDDRHQDRHGSPHGAEFPRRPGSLPGQGVAGLLPGRRDGDPLGQDRRPAGGHRRHQGRD